MHPTIVSFTLFSTTITVHSYTVFMIVACLTVFFGSLQILKKGNVPSRASIGILFGMLGATFIGARMLHIYLNLPTYLKNPSFMYSFDTTRFSLFGGIILSAFTGIILSKILKINTWKFADSITPFTGIGIAIVRIGCLLNGCCFGEITNLPWGITYPMLSQVHKYQLIGNEASLFSVHPVHPTQIYEAITAIIGSIIAIKIVKNKLPDGIAFLCFALWFTLLRWINYYFTALLPTFAVSHNFYPIFYGIVLTISGVLFFQKIQQKIASLQP